MLRHNSIVTLYGVTRVKNTGVQYLVMEAMRLGSLKDFFQRDMLDSYTELSIAASIARAVRYLHDSKKPFVHGAIRPEHVLLDAKLNAKVWNCPNKELPKELPEKKTVANLREFL